MAPTGSPWPSSTNASSTSSCPGGPLGARIKLGPDTEPWRVIVGVVPDLHLGGAIGAFDPRDEGVCLPLAQNTINRGIRPSMQPWS